MVLQKHLHENYSKQILKNSNWKLNFFAVYVQRTAVQELFIASREGTLKVTSAAKLFFVIK